MTLPQLTSSKLSPFSNKHLRNPNLTYFQDKISGIVDVLVLARVISDIPHVQKDDGELLEASVVHETQPECVTLELDIHDLHLFLVFDLYPVATRLFGLECFFAGFHLIQLLGPHLSQFFVDVHFKSGAGHGLRPAITVIMVIGEDK
jgi:hypothetical protein